jgi:hypothetical protein
MGKLKMNWGRRVTKKMNIDEVKKTNKEDDLCVKKKKINSNNITVLDNTNKKEEFIGWKKIRELE